MAATVSVQLGAAVAVRPAGAPDAAVRRLMVRAARAVLRRSGIKTAEISITLLDDSEIGALNEEHLEHTGPTDVISFALYEEGEVPVGDIYIGLDEALRQAAANGVDSREELARLAVHGTLHVLGHQHPDGAARLRSEMWLIQEEIVAELLS